MKTRGNLPHSPSPELLKPSQSPLLGVSQCPSHDVTTPPEQDGLKPSVLQEGGGKGSPAWTVCRWHGEHKGNLGHSLAAVVSVCVLGWLVVNC